MKTISEMAFEAGSDANELSGDAIERFAALVRAQSLEEAVSACRRIEKMAAGGDDFAGGASTCAAAIRALAKGAV